LEIYEMKKFLLASLLWSLAGSVFAADVPAPAYKAPSATVISTGSFYASLDGSWQRFDLPNYALGHHFVDSATLADAGALSLSQRLDGYLVRGAVGYFLPVTHTIFGSNTRLEIGGLYGHASGSASGSITSDASIAGVAGLRLDGVTNAGGVACNAVQVCTINGSSAANYASWQIHGRAAGDYRVGAVSFTPSLAVFGGEAHNHQSTTSVFSLRTLADPARVSTYNASTSLRWTDVGARAGLDLKVAVTPWAEIGVGGWAGFASRRASLSGSDTYVDNILGFYNGAGSISGIGRSATPFLANAEAGVAFKPLPALIVRGFVGVNHDSKAPGVAPPTITAFAGTTSPAGISFGSQNSYYAGGGLTWAFGEIPAGMSALGR
jgi:hypothetical protein